MIWRIEPLSFTCAPHSAVLNARQLSRHRGGAPRKRGLASGVMTALDGLGHALP
jgi:hypothetical protein